MKKNELQERLDELIKKTGEFLTEETERLLKTGAVDINSFGNDYVLPKILLVVALQNASRQWGPRSKELIKICKNLSKF